MIMSSESLKSKKKRRKQVISLLKKYYPKAICALNHSSPIQLLIATVLSAQCTDVRVNQVTKQLFKKYSSVADLANIDLKTLEKLIYSTGFFRSKARNIQSACQKIQKDFKGQVPNKLKDLLTLPGVGRKTAHVILGTAFQISSGIVVDTHVTRLSYRLGFTKAKNPLKIEQDLIHLVPRSNWIYFSHALILHGREVCKARVPRCHICCLAEICPKKDVKNKYRMRAISFKVAST